MSVSTVSETTESGVVAEAAASHSQKETQLIGYILSEEGDRPAGAPVVRMTQSKAPGRLAGSQRTHMKPSMQHEDDVPHPYGLDGADGPLARSTSAPPNLSMLLASEDGNGRDPILMGGETIAPDDPRLSQEYYNYYYSQRPLDPRLPRPLFNWPSWTSTRRGSDDIGASLLQGRTPHLEPAGLDAADRATTASASSEMGSLSLPQQHSAASSNDMGGHRSRADHAAHQDSIAAGSEPNMSVFDLQKQMQSLTLGGSAVGQRKGPPPGPPPADGYGRRSNGVPMQNLHLMNQQQQQQQHQQQQHPQQQQQQGPQPNMNMGMNGMPMGVNMGVMGPNSGMGRPPMNDARGYNVGSPPQQPMYPMGMGMPYPGMGPGMGMGMGMAPPHMYPSAYRGPGAVSPMMAVMGYGQARNTSMKQEYAYANSAGVGGHHSPGGSPNFGPHPHDLAMAGGAPGMQGQYWEGHVVGPGPGPGAPGAGMPPMGMPPMPPMGWSDESQHSPRHQPSQHTISQYARGRPAGMNLNGSDRRWAGGPHSPPYEVSPRGRGRDDHGRDREKDMMNRQHGYAPRPPRQGRGRMHAMPEYGAPRYREEDGSPTSNAHEQQRRTWIDDLRLNKGNSNYTLKHVVERHLMVELASDQYGSRFIQQRLETASDEEKQAAFDQLLPETYNLCKDVFGNYVIQKFFDYGLDTQKRILIQELLGNILDLSLQMYGCRVIQKAIDVADTQQQALIVRELVGHVMQCVKDQNGNHVIQKCIEKVPPPLIQFIVEAFQNQIFHLSTHPYGCRVIQRLLEHSSEDQRVRNAVLDEVMENTRELCKNQYGNYVIQHVIIHGSPWHRSAIVQTLRGSVLPLSKHKFASNVVEKCFAHASRADRTLLLEEILGKEDDPNSPLIAMVKDQFANYVIQKVIDVVDDPDQRAAIIARIKRHVPNLRKIPYGKHIISRIERLTGKPLVPDAV